MRRKKSDLSEDQLKHGVKTIRRGDRPPMKRNYVTMLWENCKRRALRKGLVFEIEVSDIVIPSVCPVLGIPLFFTQGRRNATDNTPSIDRIDNSVGYTRENIRIVSHRVNSLKRDYTIDRLEAELNEKLKILDYMKRVN